MKKIKLLIVALSMFVLVAPLMANSCLTPEDKEVTTLFDRWNNSLATLKSSEVVKNYAKNAILHPTLKNAKLKTNETIAEYFDNFLQYSPKAEILERTIFKGCNFAVDTGIYKFTLTEKVNGKENVTYATARYTFTYAYENGQWLITSHLSALVPEDKKNK
jgi:hypothetical protein